MGLEYISQPQVFLSPITAVGGIQSGLYDSILPPLYTSFYTWTSTSSVTASVFPLNGIETLTNRSGSYIVTVGGVVQSPTNYTVNPNTRLLTFDFSVNADTPVVVTQIGTIATSALNITDLTATNSVFQNSIFNNINATNLLVTKLTALTSTLNIVDITQYELSGFNVQGNANIIGNTTVTGLISTSSVTTNNLSALNYVITDNGSFIGATSATTMNIGFLSARSIDLIHSPANDGIDPILNIGETDTAGFSGFRIRYEEPTNLLIGSSRTGTTVLTSFMINTTTGQVGISGLPASGQALTVTGNISATGTLKAANTWPNRQYFMLTADEGQFAANTVFALMSTQPLTINPNQIYEVTSYFVLSSTSITTTTYTFGFSANNTFTVIDGYFQNVGNITTTLTLGRDLRGLTPSTSINILPAQSYNTPNIVGSTYFTRISAGTTTQVLLTGTASVSGRTKAGSTWTSVVVG